ncbi:CUE domain-containing protein 1 [Microplitis mediator]|uniref:CUE domain-containing protein 1 n=1 Tax=Microplitis mediator TaxID=375433 RepID=UPI0025540FB6|nr:CUE domain-containing protein 1 [Microplitis mediator]
MASAAEQQQTTLEFYQAMADFKNMFPQMDDDVIEAVLRSNQGAVDTTIDQLLAMSTDNENEKIRSELEQSDGSADSSPKAAVHQEVLVGVDAPDAKQSKNTNKWKPPLLGPLPDSFLRIPQQILEDAHDPVAQENSLLEDERIAMFLQNEEFMSELRWNEDFLNTLEHDSKLHGSEKCSGTDEDLFRERLKNMGKVSRRKFAQLTKVFTRTKKRGGRQLLPPTASCDDLLDPEDSRSQS